MKTFFKFSFASLACVLAGNVAAIPVDLSTWQTDGGGNWTLNTTNSPNDSVNQSLNSIPTVFYNGENSQGTALSGTITVQTGNDNDFIGFVLGYDNNDLFGTNATTNYILVDWKQGTQAGWDAGLAISRVTGGPIASSGTDTGGNAWTHTGHVNLIERAATLGDTGWVNFTEYLFDIVFTPTNIQVSVDGVQQFDINGSFEDGSFGFYNFSQPNVLYAGIIEEDVPDVDPGPQGIPEPTTLVLLALGILGIGFMRKIKNMGGQ